MMLETHRNILKDSRDYAARIKTKATVDTEKGVSISSSSKGISISEAITETTTKTWDWDKLFWSKVARGKPDECWHWLGQKHSNGYGSFYFGGHSYKAHRVAYALFTGQDISENMFACHHCDNRICCNPSHLFIGTHRDNMLDAISKGRGSYGKKRRFSWQTVEEVRRLYATGECSQITLAEKYGTDQSHISRVLNGTYWGRRRPPGSGRTTPATVSYNYAFDFDFSV